MATLSELIVTVGASIGGFASAMKEVTDTLGNLGDTATASLAHFDEIISGFGEVAAAAGIATGAFETAKDALEAFAKAEDVKTSFELLTGSAGAANDAFEGLKDTAIRMAIPFEELVDVSQRLAPQFGVGTSEMASVLQAAGDAAAATGRDFQTIADGLDRISITGQVSTRQMVQFGVSMSDIATAMGKSIPDAIELLKKGGQDAQADVNAVVGAIEAKFGGAAEKIGENLTGQFTKLKDELGFVSEDLGAALAPIAEDLIAGLKELEPTLKGIADGAVPAVAGFLDMGKALGDLIPDFLKVVATGPSMIGLGTAIGFTAQAGKLLVDILHAAVLETADFVESLNPFSDGLKHLTNDFTQAGIAIGKDLTQFGDIATKGDELSKTFGDIKIPVFGDTVGNIGAASTALSNMAEMAKALKEATKDLATADRDHAEYLKSSYIPAVMSVEDAESKLHDAKLNYLAADQAEQTTRQALLEAQKNKTADIIAIEAALKTQSQATKDAHLAYTEAIKDQNLAKTTLATVTKDLQSAEDAIAASEKSSYIPAILDHITALNNITTAEDNRQLAIKAVQDAEDALKAAYDSKDAIAIKDAEDALTETKKNLAAATTALTEANKDEKTSMELLKSVASELDAGEKASIETKKKLNPQITDINKALATYKTALGDSKIAVTAMDDAEAHLRDVRKDGNATGQELVDAENAAKTARDANSVATAKLDDATQKLTGDFRVNRDTLDLLKTHMEDWTESQKAAQVALSDLGIQSGAVMDKMAADSKRDYDAIVADTKTSFEERRQAQIAYLQDTLDADVQNGRDITAAQQLDLAKLKQQETDYRADSVTQWSALYTTIDGDVKGFAESAIATLITGKGSFKDEVVTMLDNIAVAVADTFLKKATDAIAQFIAGAITDLLSGKGLGGVLQSLKDIGSSAASAFKGISGGVANIGASGTGAVGDIVGSGDTLAGVGSSGTSAIGSTISSALGGVLGIANLGVSILSGIVSGVQQAHANNLLNEIEISTRETKNISLDIQAAIVHVDSTLGAIYPVWQATSENTQRVLNDLDWILKGVDAIAESGMGAGHSSDAALEGIRIAIIESQNGITEMVSEVKMALFTAIHTDLVSIWGEVTAIKDSVIAMAAKAASSVAALTQTPSLGYDSSQMIGNDIASASVAATLSRMAAGVPAGSQSAPSPLIKIFLDGRELAQSYALYLSQSGTVAPAAA